MFRSTLVRNKLCSQRKCATRLRRTLSRPPTPTPPTLHGRPPSSPPSDEDHTILLPKPSLPVAPHPPTSNPRVDPSLVNLPRGRYSPRVKSLETKTTGQFDSKASVSTIHPISPESAPFSKIGPNFRLLIGTQSPAPVGDSSRSSPYRSAVACRLSRRRRPTPGRRPSLFRRRTPRLSRRRWFRG